MASGFASSGQAASVPTPSTVTDAFNRVNECARTVRENAYRIGRVADELTGPIPEKGVNPAVGSPIPSNLGSYLNELEQTCRELSLQVERLYAR